MDSALHGATRAVARHLARLGFSDLPAQAIHAAKRSLLDAIGVSLGASGLEPACRPYAELALQSSGPCSLLGWRGRVSPLMAALANGALAHALDYEDAYDGTPTHPNASSVPVAIALAEKFSALDGRAVIVALAAASDLVCRMGLALDDNPDRFGFYTPAILGTFGAAACAAKLLGLDEDGCVAALGLALTQSMCSSQLKCDPRSPLRAVREGFAAQAGLLAAELAAHGARSFEAALEGEHGFYAAFARGAYSPQRLLDGLGDRFLGADVSYKPWPSCRGTHAYIDAASELRARHGIAAEQIERVVAYGADLNRMLTEPVQQKQQPATAIDAKFSIPFCVAVALQRGAVTLDDFGPEALASPSTLALARRVRFQVDPAARMRDATSGALLLTLRTGERHHTRVERPLGHPTRPLDDTRLVAKFLDCAARAASPVPAEQLQELATQLLELEAAASAQAVLSLTRRDE
jgi:2-methylcitrate dehydratase PrpD